METHALILMTDAAFQAIGGQLWWLVGLPVLLGIALRQVVASRLRHGNRTGSQSGSR